MPCFGLLCTSLEPASVRRAKRYRKLVPQLFPPEEPSVEGALEPKVVRAIEKLTEYAEVNPDRFPKISRKIFRRAMRDLRAGRFGYVRVAVVAHSKLLQCHTKAAPLTGQQVVALVRALLQRKVELLDTLALQLLEEFVALQTQGSRWWSDQLDLFIPSLGYLMQKMDGPESRRRTALQVVARVLDILVRDAHLPTGWPALVEATVQACQDHPNVRGGGQTVAEGQDCAVRATSILSSMCSMSPTAAGLTLDAALRCLGSLGCWEDGDAEKTGLREVVLGSMRRGLAEAGQGPMLFAALASYVAQCACRGSVPSSLLNRTMVEAGKLGAAAAVPALVKSLVVLSRAVMHLPYGGPQHAQVLGIIAVVARQSTTVLPLLDSLGAAAQQLPHNDQAVAVYALDSMAQVLERPVPGEPSVLQAALTRLMAPVLSAAHSVGLLPGLEEAMAKRPHRSRSLSPPLLRAILSVVVPGGVRWDDAARVAALRLLCDAVGYMDGKLSAIDCQDVCHAMVEIWMPAPEAGPGNVHMQRVQKGMQRVLDKLALRGPAGGAPVALWAAKALLACMRKAPTESLVQFAWAAGALRAVAGGRQMSSLSAQYVSDRILDGLASLAGKASLAVKASAAGAIRNLRCGLGDVSLPELQLEGEVGPLHEGSQAFDRWRHAADDALRSEGQANASLVDAGRAEWSADALVRAMHQGGLAPQGLTAALRLLKGPVKTMQGRTLQATLTVLARSGGLSSSEMNGHAAGGAHGVKAGRPGSDAGRTDRMDT